MEPWQAGLIIAGSVAAVTLVVGLLSWWFVVSWDAMLHQYGWCSNPGCGSKRHQPEA